MALLTRKTEEEKQAERAAKAEEKARKAAEAERRRAEQRALEAQAAAAYNAFTADLPKWEYKVLTNTALAGWGGGTIKGLEPMLNNFAAEGWRVISMSFTGQIDQFLSADKNHLYVVLERPAQQGGHTGHPVASPGASA